MAEIITRNGTSADIDTLVRGGLHPLLARLYAARGIRQPQEIGGDIAQMLPPEGLLGIGDAASRLADAIDARTPMTVVADYDCDGATACAVAIRGLRMLGADVDYLVPNRFEYGYGLTPEIVALARRHPSRHPAMLITVDNGIASIEGVAAARAAGIDVLVTDHHLPGAALPDACAIVNPNQPGCSFGSKHLAGVGVIFYVLLATRAELRRRGRFDAHGDAPGRPQPNLAQLLDLVAVGTVADVVPLDANNRLLVAHGLARIRAGKVHAGLAALFRVAGRESRNAGVQDIGFSVGPRLNAAGRLADMSLGVECLLTDDPGRAWSLAEALDRMNKERRQIESGMQEAALRALATCSDIAARPADETGATRQETVSPMPAVQRSPVIAVAEPGDAIGTTDDPDSSAGSRATWTLFDAEWHQGVIGIVASRLKEKLFRPVITFAPADADGEHIKGSGRSIPGFHLRDALDCVAKRHPDMLHKFGGHAMAAGLTLRRADLTRFAAAFEEVGREWLSAETLRRVVVTDGELDDAYFTPQAVELLEKAIWGQGFPAPLFSGTFAVRAQSLVKDKHLKLHLERERRRFDAIWFNRQEPLPAHARLAYRLSHDTYNGVSRVQMIVEHAEY